MSDMIDLPPYEKVGTRRRIISAFTRVRIDSYGRVTVLDRVMVRLVYDSVKVPGRGRLGLVTAFCFGQTLRGKHVARHPITGKSICPRWVSKDPYLGV